MQGMFPVLFASAKGATYVIQTFITPVIVTLSALAGLVSVFFLVVGGIHYMSSRGNPEKLIRAKRILKNALVGLVLVIAAATLTTILSHAYGVSGGEMMANKLPDLQPITPNSGNFVGAIVNAITGFLNLLVQGSAGPFLTALDYFLKSTPLMADNSGVFNLWLTVVALADGLLVLVIALLGFHVMSYSVLGFDEVDIKQLIPQLAFAFLLMNTSIFAIDAVIGLSNVMIKAVSSGAQVATIWTALKAVMELSAGLGVVALLIMTAMLILALILLVYYVGRLLVLYLGAVLSPLVVLLWLIPAFKDFAVAALKAYLVTVFVLFVHVVVMAIAALMLAGVIDGNLNGQPNSLTALLVGLAAMIALLKVQGVMQEFSHAASLPRTARELTGAFIRGVGYARKTATLPYDAPAKAIGFKRKAQGEIQGKKRKSPSVHVTVIKSDSKAGGKASEIVGKSKHRPIPTGVTQDAREQPLDKGEQS